MTGLHKRIAVTENSIAATGSDGEVERSGEDGSSFAADSTILFVAPLPGPITGQSVACQALFEELKRHCRVESVDLSKQGFRQGASSLGRVFEVVSIVARVWRLQRRADVLYVTISESFAGNAKDLLIYLVCFPKLSRMMIHLHGGAGMRDIMGESPWPWRWLNRFFLRRIGSIVVLGPRHVPIFAGAVPESRIHIVPNFAEGDLFTTHARIDDKFDDCPPVRLLFLSNLLPGKGHVELVEALDLIGDATRSRLKVDIAGGFESLQQQKSFLDAIEGKPNITYHGIVRGEAKRTLFANAHIFCLPTYYPYEGQPISILEAYASGCMVITTDHSGILDIFEHEANGYCVEKRSPKSLAEAIERAASEVASVRSMAHDNLRLASDRYRADRYTTALVQLMDQLASSSTAEPGVVRAEAGD